LVDCIVPGKLPAAEQEEVEKKLDTEDELMIMSEPYRLWAIETNSERTKNILSFSRCDSSVVLAPDINKFRELKLRLLNATHTLSCGLAHLSGFTTVKEAMQDETFVLFVTNLMKEEIIPLVAQNDISTEEALLFARTGNRPFQKSIHRTSLAEHHCTVHF
jgi:tagaturonate reductase